MTQPSPAGPSRGKKAFVTGAAGQDGSYLVELLLEKGYEVHGLVRSESPSRLGHLQTLVKDLSLPLRLHSGDLTDQGRLTNLLRAIGPGEVYNLAAFSDGQATMEDPENTAQVNGLGPLRLLESLRRTCPQASFFQASSAEVFGPQAPSPQDEATPLDPRTPYAAAKAFAQGMTAYYRTAHGMRTYSGILFNHESPRRSPAFVTRKITLGLAGILSGRQKELRLGSLDAKRDWGFAKDHARAMWLMLQKGEPGEYVVATGESHTVREFVEEAFGSVGLDPWKYVREEKALQRKWETKERLGNSAKARKLLGWEPTLDFKGLVRLMVEADLREAGLKPPFPL